MPDYIYNPESGELYHYGVKGMKWGARRAARYERNASYRKAHESFQRDLRNLQADGRGNDTAAITKRAAQYDAERKAAKDKYAQTVGKVGKKAIEVGKDHTGLNTHGLEAKQFRARRKAVGNSRTTGAKLVTNILAGPFANRTYNSVIAAGGSKAGAVGMTAAATMLGGPVGHIAVSTLYTSYVSEITYRN